MPDHSRAAILRRTATFANSGALVQAFQRSCHSAFLAIRGNWRLLKLGIHLLAGIATVRFVFPLVSPVRRARIRNRWALDMLHLLGIHVRPLAVVPAERALIVCNHISWLDIFVINSQLDAHFVCKEEVRKWPLIGWLVAATGTLFIARGNNAAAARTMHALSDRLRRDERIVFFPEGTTTNGQTLLPFTTALFEAANIGDAVVVPMCLRYYDTQGQQSLAPAYDGDITFMQCLRSVVRESRIEAELVTLETLPAGMTRRDYAMRSRAQIAKALGYDQGN